MTKFAFISPPRLPKAALFMIYFYDMFWAFVGCLIVLWEDLVLPHVVVFVLNSSSFTTFVLLLLKSARFHVLVG
jgi:hypothetical protein